MGMRDYLLIENNFTRDDIDEIYRWIDIDSVWVDGHQSLESVNSSDEEKLKTKTNFQCEFTLEGEQALSDIVFNKMDTRTQFIEFTVASSSATPLVSRTETEGFYKPHHDYPTLGDFSTTIFLNDNFEGGELCLWINGEEIKFKPPAGSSVTYKTGTPHRVNTVTKGHRDVVIFWTHSRLKDSFEYDMYQGLTNALDYIESNRCENLEDASKDPHFILQNLRDKIIRKNHRE
jgi:PKHD-type hydroxylase